MKTNYKKNEDAVSPVIGVILMVAITCILAAVTGAFVFGMGSDQKASHYVAVKPVYDNGNIVLTYYGGDGATFLDHLTVEVAGVAQPDWIPSSVGNSTIITGPYSTPTKILVKSVYIDDLMNEHIVLMQDF